MVRATTRFAARLEVGCPVGVAPTRLLAARCHSPLVLNVVEQAPRAAQVWCAYRPWIRFARAQVPNIWPDGRSDLIVLPELLYFFAPGNIDRIAGNAARSVLPDGRVLSVC